MLKILLPALCGVTLLFATGCSSDEPARQPTAAPAPVQVYYPPPCEQMRSCVKAFGQVNPGNRHHYDQAWSEVHNAARANDTTQAKDKCARALKAYAVRPGAPASCR